MDVVSALKNHNGDIVGLRLSRSALPMMSKNRF